MSKNIRNAGKELMLASGCAVLALTALTACGSPSPEAPGGDNPYASIAHRNIFDLHEIIPTYPRPEEPPSGLKLTGISTVLGIKQAFVIETKPGAAGKPATVHSLMLKEGQRSGDLEVMEINPEARTVKIKNGDAELLICLGGAEARK